jgi:hypothetical protein
MPEIQKFASFFEHQGGGVYKMTGGDTAAREMRPVNDKADIVVGSAGFFGRSRRNYGV